MSWKGIFHHKQKMTAFGNLDELHCFYKYDCFARNGNAVPHLSCPVVNVVVWGSPFFKDCQQCSGAIKNYDLKSGFLIKKYVFFDKLLIFKVSQPRRHLNFSLFSAAIFWDGHDFMRDRGLVIKMSVEYIALRQLNYQIIGNPSSFFVPYSSVDLINSAKRKSKRWSLWKVSQSFLIRPIKRYEGDFRLE